MSYFPFFVEIGQKRCLVVGGGTVAFCTAELDIDTIDIGGPVLSMHAPFEVTAKIDVYSLYRAFVAFIG